MTASNDTRTQGGWLAFAFPVPQSQGSVLLALFSLQRLTQGLSPSGTEPDGTVMLLLDQENRPIVSSGNVGSGQHLFEPVPAGLATLPLNTPLSSGVTDPPTRRAEVGAGTALPTLGGRLLVLAPLSTALVPSNRSAVAGRNTPLLLLAILVIVVLTATAVALPIVRPIRRATREIETTTIEVRHLAEDAHRIAKEHTVGTTILTGASKRLNVRRQSIIRDAKGIVQYCKALYPRLQWLIRLTQQSSNIQASEILQAVYQGLQHMEQLAISIGGGLESDTSLQQLDGAMQSAREISTQFEEAGKQLELGAEQLQDAAATLL